MRFEAEFRLMEFMQAPRNSAPLTQPIGDLLEVVVVDVREYDRTW